MKKILVPTDFSDNARNAVDFIVSFYGADNLHITLLNSYEVPSTGGGAMLVSIDDLMEKECKKDLEREERYLNEKYPELSVLTEPFHGSIEDAVERTGDRTKSQFVVMGTQGASGLKKVLIGSHTQRVISNASLPTLAIPENCTYEPMKTIVFAADLKSIASNEILKPLLEILKQSGAHLHLIHVEAEPSEVDINEEKNRLQLDTFLEGHAYTYHLIVQDDVVEAIDQFVEEHQADLLVMIPRKVSFWDKLFKTSVTKQFAYHTKVPLLALKEK